MPDVKVLYSETVDAEVYAYRLFPAIAGLLAAMAAYQFVRAFLSKVPPSTLKKASMAALPAAGLPGVLLIALRLAAVSAALGPYLTVAGGLLLAVALVAGLSLRTGRRDPLAAAAAIASALVGVGVFLLSMALMLGLMQWVTYKEPMICLLGIVLPAGITLGVGAWPVVARLLAARTLAARTLAAKTLGARPRVLQVLAAVAGGAGVSLLAAIVLFAVGVPDRLPKVAVIPMTAFPLAAAAGIRAARYVSMRTYGVLFALRLVIVAGLVMFLAHPVLSITQQQIEKRKLVFAIDTSASMSARDGANVPTRLDRVKQNLGPRYIEKLKKDFDVAFLSFSGAAVEVDEDGVAELKPDGKVTSLFEPVARAKSAFPGADIASVVLVSDGIDNSGSDSLKPIIEQGLIVNCVGVGAVSDEREQIKDVAIKYVESPRYATVNNVTEIKAFVESTGIVRKVNVSLTRDGKELAQAPLLLESARQTQEVTLRFTPDTVGHFEFEVSVPMDPEERIQQNNVYPFSLIVTDPKIKVLYVEGTLRWEYRWLKRNFDMDPNVELLALVQTRRDVFMKQGGSGAAEIEIFPTDIETLKKFDVMILGDLDSSLFSGRQLEMIEDAVKDGAGLLMIGGEAAFGRGGYAGTPVAKLLPVEMGGRGDKSFKEAFPLQLTAEGKVHPIFQGTLMFFEGRDKAVLPELGGNNEVLGAKPAAMVLAVNPDKTAHDGKKMVVAAVQQYGNGRTMALTIDTTWRWYMQLRGIGRETPYTKFWGQTIRWLANQEVKEREQKPGITVFTDKRSYEPAEPVRLFARARAEGGLATNDAVLHAIIQTPTESKTPVQLVYVPGTTGEYEATFEPPTPGKYDVEVNASLNQQPLGEKAELDFRVGNPNLEFDQLDLNEPLLKKIAAETGGRYYSLIMLDDMIRSLQGSEKEKRMHRQVSLWDAVVMPAVDVTRPIGFLHRFLTFLAKDPQGVFFAFLLLVTVEWTIRKRRMLS